MVIYRRSGQITNGLLGALTVFPLFLRDYACLTTLRHWRIFSLSQAVLKTRRVGSNRVLGRALGSSSLLGKKTSILSFGQRQRIAFKGFVEAVSMALFDEPFSHLDKANQAIVWDLVLEDIQSKQAGLIITSLDTDNKLIDLTIKRYEKDAIS